MSDRGVSSVVGVLLFVAITVVVAGVFGTVVFSLSPDSAPPKAAVGLSTDSTDQTITLTHRGGGALDPAALRLRIAVGGEPIAHQPPIPFFAATGFRGGPTGPFNSAYEGNWTVGQSASLRLASTNTRLRPGDVVTVRLYVSDQLLVVLEARA